MKYMVSVIVIIWTLHKTTVLAKFGTEKQTFGYIDVRPGCHMFYWLFYARGTDTVHVKKPLLIWLQGGPGSASTGHANFLIMGPLDIDLQERETTWVNIVNVMYVDSPVGVGYSYVDNEDLYVRSNEAIAEDLVVFLAGFYDKNPEFLNVPLYICGQSFGAKMAVDFALALDRSFKEANITSNLRAVILGNPWISPLDYMLAWSTLLESLGQVDADGAAKIYEGTLVVRTLMAKGDYVAASKARDEVQKIIFAETHGLNFHNIMKKYKLETTEVSKNVSKIKNARQLFKYGNKKEDEVVILNYLMNGEVKPSLQIPEHVNWVAHSNEVFQALLGEFMKPATESVALLLNTTDVKVVIYNGNNDLICGTLGQQSWIDNLSWNRKGQYIRAHRKAIWIKDQLEGYVKQSDNFKFYWILGAGHCAPADNPYGVGFMLNQIISTDY